MVRIRRAGEAPLLLTPRGVFEEEERGVRGLFSFADLVGYDWITWAMPSIPS
ncbi:MAG: hypothetical protein ACE5GJ_01725 [Gemmatimonadota bacterium]